MHTLQPIVHFLAPIVGQRMHCFIWMAPGLRASIHLKSISLTPSWGYYLRRDKHAFLHGVPWRKSISWAKFASRQYEWLHDAEVSACAVGKRTKWTNINFFMACKENTCLCTSLEPQWIFRVPFKVNFLDSMAGVLQKRQNGEGGHTGPWRDGAWLGGIPANEKYMRASR